MIQSMTGYGKAALRLPTKTISLEIKTLNSKNFDLNTRIHQTFREKELEIRKAISNKLVRGKVDFGLYVEMTGEETPVELNIGVIKNYMSQLGRIAKGDELKLMEMAIKMPDTVKTDKTDIDPEEFEAIMNGLAETLERVQQHREDEGAVLEADFKLRITNIRNYLDDVGQMDPERLETVKERLNKSLANLAVEVDQNRFEQELIYYLEKYDITEEKVRLANHLNYFEETLAGKTSNGKKLVFISQEIGREINTIGSKANHAPMQQLVVQMKDELEKIKEQLLNVL